MAHAWRVMFRSRPTHSGTSLKAELSKKLEGASYFYSASKLVLNRGLFTELPLAGIGLGLSDTVTLVRV